MLQAIACTLTAWPDSGHTRKSLTVASRADQVPVTRAFVGGVLGTTHPCTDTAVLLVSELVTNSVQHSASCCPGRTVTVSAVTDSDSILVEVTDLAGLTVPAMPCDDDAMAEGGRGLRLVQSLAVSWGYRRHGLYLTTWFICTR